MLTFAHARGRTLRRPALKRSHSFDAELIRKDKVALGDLGQDGQAGYHPDARMMAMGLASREAGVASISPKVAAMGAGEQRFQPLGTWQMTGNSPSASSFDLGTGNGVVNGHVLNGYGLNGHRVLSAVPPMRSPRELRDRAARRGNKIGGSVDSARFNTRSMAAAWLSATTGATGFSVKEAPNQYSNGKDMEAQVPLLDMTRNGKAAATPRKGETATGWSRASSDEAPSARIERKPRSEDTLTKGSVLAEAQQNADNMTSSSKKHKFRGLLAFGAAWLVSGVAFFMSWGFTLIDALYLMVQILTTVGYGDMVPETDAEKIITAFFVLSSTLLMAGLISHMIDMLLDSQAAMLEASLQQKEEQIKAGQSKDPKEDEDRVNKLKKTLCVQIGIFCCFVAAGTFFFHFVEGCSCSYGKTRIEGCDVMDCYETGGHTKSLVDGFYMSVITLTTVGFGDQVSESMWGRLFSIFWMLFGVGSIINLVGSVTDFLNEIINGSEKKKVAQDLFDKMDQDGDGNLDRLEFLRMQLVMLGMASEDDLDSIMNQFDLIDESGDGNISLDEFKQYYM